MDFGDVPDRGRSSTLTVEVARCRDGDPGTPDQPRHQARRLQPLRGDLRARADHRGRPVTAIRGNDDDPLSRGYICPKGVSIADVHADPDRLRRPVRRVGEGRTPSWVEIGWDEALDLVADGLAARSTEHGRNAVGVYLGNPNAHSLGSATHGIPIVKSLRTRNRFSASSVDQIPHQFVGVAAVRPPAAAAGPRHRPDVVLPGLRRQPDGLQRLADDGARLPATGCATSRRAAAGWWCSTRGAPRPPRSRPSTTSSGPAPTPWCCWRCSTCCSTRDSTRPPAYVDGADAGRRRGRRLHPGARRAGQRRAGRGHPADRARVRGGRRGGGVRPDRRVDARLRLGLPVGDPAAQPADRQPRPRGRGALPRARRSTSSDGASSGPATSTSGAAGSATSRSSPASCRSRRSARRSRRRATARSARC